MTFDRIPTYVSAVLNKLIFEGYEAYLVGGCVRDILLGYEPHDYDITTSATPDEVEQLFSHTIPTGKKYGTITILYDSEDGMQSDEVEVTTFRKDCSYSDGRRPDKVEFGTSLEEDVMRRDFTVNALAWSPKTGIIDYVNGLQDLDKGIIRCVGVPSQRFKEDALRTVRAIRFALQYNFTIEDTVMTGTLYALYDAIIEDSCLQHVSKERIHDEIIRIIPNLNNRFYGQTGEDVKILKEDMILRCLLNIFDMEDVWKIEHLLPPSEYDTIEEKLYHIYQFTPIKMKEQKFSNKAIKYVNTVRDCCKLYEECIEEDKFKCNFSYFIRYLLSKYPSDIVKFVLTKPIVTAGTNFNKSTLISSNLYDKLQAEAFMHCLSLNDLAINGDDLMKLGYKDKEIGEKLNLCLNEVLKYPEHNEKEFLINFITNSEK